MLRVVAITFASTALLAWPAHDLRPRLVWNVSASAPIGPYAITPDCPCQIGTLVLITPPPRIADDLAARHALAAGVLLLKRIAAGAGQQVCRRDTLVLIDGVPRARAHRRDRTGRPLPHWSGCLRLGAQELFLLNNSPLSLDSRYFGPIDARLVVGRAHPLWLPEGAQ